MESGDMGMVQLPPVLIKGFTLLPSALLFMLSLNVHFKFDSARQKLKL